jgi:hypothetical protein
MNVNNPGGFIVFAIVVIFIVVCILLALDVVNLS